MQELIDGGDLVGLIYDISTLADHLKCTQIMHIDGK